MLRRKRSHNRHWFTDLTDILASPYNLGFSFYNWGFRVLGRGRHEAFRKRVIDLAGLRGDETVLDAGCGTGLTLLRLGVRHPGCRIAGLDLSPKMIEVANTGARERGQAVELQVGSILDLPYRDALFDVVLTNIMFHHLDITEKKRAVGEIARVLKPGGRYVSAEFGPRATNALQRCLAKGDYTLVPAHLDEAGLSISFEELSRFVWGLRVTYRVAVKPGDIGS